MLWMCSLAVCVGRGMQGGWGRTRGDCDEVMGVGPGGGEARPVFHSSVAG
jgi:hypothetical protein